MVEGAKCDAKKLADELCASLPTSEHGPSSMSGFRKYRREITACCLIGGYKIPPQVSLG